MIVGHTSGQEKDVSVASRKHVSVASRKHREHSMREESSGQQDIEAIRPIAVVGPTASGKSALGIALAHELNGEIVNVDSMQLYRGMDIGTAKLSISEREGIPHHQLDVWEVTETASVARFQQDARSRCGRHHGTWENPHSRGGIDAVCASACRRLAISAY